MSEKTVAPFGTWRSPIDATMLVEGGLRLSQVSIEDGAVYWVEGRPSEGGRSVVVRGRPGATPTDVTPEGFNARTTVHEYGGGAYAVHRGVVFASNFTDQRLYRHEPGRAPTPITADTGGRYRYADGRLTPDGSLLICVRERHEEDGVVNELVAIHADGSGDATLVVGGRDFFSTPRISPDGTKLAWQTWDLPYLPWDGCELWVADLDPAGVISGERVVAGTLAHESIFQPGWDPGGGLHFVSDRSGWWNLYREIDGAVQAICPMDAEFGWPQWVFGVSSYAFLDDGRIACIWSRDGAQHVAVIDPRSDELLDLDLPYDAIDDPWIAAEGQAIAFIGASASVPPRVVLLDFLSRSVDVLKESAQIAVAAEYLSAPRAIEFPTEGGLTAHAFYYPPESKDFAGPPGELPPLMVMSHGGPTSAVCAELDLGARYWTSRGFALVDVNYGGSTGYGRAYRERLNGNWGVVDTMDCINAARHLVHEGEVDRDRLLIRGGSAGGYTTLCALTFHDDFAAGASYYGISDLEPFAKPGGTHKFESRYEHTLVGPYPEAAELYRARSPIHFVDMISCPMILFQGAEDEVVPPAQSEIMVDALRSKGLPHAYLLFEGEQHGFRKAKHIVRSHEAELSFYAQILGFEPGDDVEPVSISNLGGGVAGGGPGPPPPPRGRVLPAHLGCQRVMNTGCRGSGDPRNTTEAEPCDGKESQRPSRWGATFRKDPVRIPRWLDAVSARGNLGRPVSRGCGMRRAVRLAAVIAVLAVIAAACGGDGSPESSPSASAGGEIQPGGTLHLAMESDVASAFDPQKEYYQLSFVYFKCCILRTLLATKPIPAEEGGNVLHPDLAADLPTVSDDGLTYTFTIKPGLHYAPPLQDVEITAQDFVRALERESDPKASSNGYPFYYSVIEGFDDFGAGEAESISGLSAPDDHTFVVTLSEPSGDMPWRFAMPATAPIPPNPADPDARLGVAEGHTTNYGRFLVASGPYMFEGSESLDFSVPAKDQEPVAGYVPGREIVLVRNPSYDASSDDLRSAYPDRIEAAIGGEPADLFNKIETGEIDYVADEPDPPANVLQEYSTNPDKQPYLHVYQLNVVTYISMNLGVPPFDDVHVRKAINYAYDKAGGRQLAGGPLTGANAGHIFPDGLLDNKLKDYNPYATDGDNGDIEKAKAEMALSKYDSDGDGVCDDPVCDGVITLGIQQDPGPRIMALFTENVAPLGITVTPRSLDGPVIYSKCISSPDQFPLCLNVGWVQDYPDAYTFGPPLFGEAALYPACCNYSLLGASEDQLTEWGYPAGTTVPNVDDRMTECAQMPIGDERYQCWADFDTYMMEEVVPWVPKTFSNLRDITSSRVVNYSFDYWGAQASFGEFAFANGGQE